MTSSIINFVYEQPHELLNLLKLRELGNVRKFSNMYGALGLACPLPCLPWPWIKQKRRSWPCLIFLSEILVLIFWSRQILLSLICSIKFFCDCLMDFFEVISNDNRVMAVDVVLLSLWGLFKLWTGFVSSRKLYHCRSVFRFLLNILNGSFCENSERQKAVTYFRKRFIFAV